MRILVKRRIIMGFVISFLAYCLGAPVYVLSVSRRDGETVFRRIVSPSTPIVFGYIHSVERTPVEDELRAAGGRFWQWEVRVRSHNAGLPSEPGSCGRFFPGEEFMVFRGGRLSFPMMRYRAGNDAVGENTLRIAGEKWLLHDLFPGELLLFKVDRMCAVEYFLSH
jgi:hypothetical protein